MACERQLKGRSRKRRSGRREEHVYLPRFLNASSIILSRASFQSLSSFTKYNFSHFFVSASRTSSVALSPSIFSFRVSGMFAALKVGLSKPSFSESSTDLFCRSEEHTSELQS